MNDIEITVCGNVCTDPARRAIGNDREVTTFRIASSPRLHRDGKWVDGPTSFLTVSSFGALGRHVFSSVHRGDPVIVRGRLRIRTWEAEGVQRTSADIDAVSVGHDLALGTSVFQRPRHSEDPWAGVDPALAGSAREAGLTPERAARDLEAIAS